MACGLQASMGLGASSSGAAGSRTSASAPEQGVGPGYGNETWVGPNGHLHPSAKPLDSKAKATENVMVTGQRREGGDETYIEVQGPASVGARSSVPYTQVLAKFRKRAEEAISRKRIPKSRLKRVREYFESLDKGS
jgi:hypothetical protein